MSRILNKGIAVLLTLCVLFAGMPQVSAAAAGTEAVRIDFAAILNPQLSEEEEQTIIIALRAEEEITAADLTLVAADGSVREVSAVSIEDNKAAFRFSAEQGTYFLGKVIVQTETEETIIDLKAAGIEAAFGVDVEIETTPDDVLYDEETMRQIEESAKITVMPQLVLTDEENALLNDTSVEDALSYAESTTISLSPERIRRPDAAASASAASTADSTNSTNGNLIVVIDPGHDNRHGGATSNGYYEEQLTLKIAQYFKAELETYQGVTVYLTRETEDCPYPYTQTGEASTSTYCNVQRTVFAKNVGADVYVSVHLNAYDYGTPTGAEIYYPNPNYNQEVYQEGKDLAKYVITELQEIGLTLHNMFSDGTGYLNAGEGSTYPDGSTKDRYIVINQNKLNGIPAILIEHCYLTTESDRQKWLTTDNGLEALGVADATGVAKYYGLTKTSGGLGQTRSVHTGTVNTWDVDDFNGTFEIGVTGVASSTGVGAIRIACWTESDKSDLHWYTAVQGSDDGYYAKAYIENHAYHYGTYYVDAYLKDENGGTWFLGSKTVTLTLPAELKPVVSAEAGENGTYNLAVTHIPGAGTSAVSRVRFAVWSDTGWQDDLIWYQGTYADGLYTAAADLASHKTTGKYYVDVYRTEQNGKSVYVGGTTFTVDQKSSANVVIQNVDTGAGTFDVCISDASSTFGVRAVRVAAWSEKDQSNLFWYTAVEQTDGTWLAEGNLSRHNNIQGSYYVDTYVTDRLGKNHFVSSKKVSMLQNPPEVSSERESSGIYLLTAKNVPIKGGTSISKVRFAVWSETGWQDDLIWYEGKPQDGVYTVEMNCENHLHDGKFYVDVWVNYANGTSSYMGGTTFEEVALNNAPVTVTYAEMDNGLFRLSLNNYPGAGSSIVNKVQFAVWSDENWQDDLIWYTGVLYDKTYRIDVNLLDHHSNGKFYVDVWVKLSNGKSAYAGGTTLSYYPGTQAVIFKGMSEKETVEYIGPLFTENQKQSGILACVSIAQFILESGYGTTDLAQSANNVFGMKASLSGNTWSGSTWDGKSIYTKNTVEYYDGVRTVVTAQFRKYPCVEDSIADHAAYLLGAKNGSKLRYEGLKGETDYRTAIQIIKDGGYATDPSYVDKICNIIERFDLTRFNVDE